MKYIPYSLRKLKLLQIKNHEALTIAIVKEIFQDFMLKTVGLYVHQDQITADVCFLSVSRYRSDDVDIYWAEFCSKNSKPIYDNNFHELNRNQFFNISVIFDILEDDDLSSFDNLVESYVYGIIQADHYETSGLMLSRLYESE